MFCCWSWSVFLEFNSVVTDVSKIGNVCVFGIIKKITFYKFFVMPQKMHQKKSDGLNSRDTISTEQITFLELLSARILNV